MRPREMRQVRAAIPVTEWSTPAAWLDPRGIDHCPAVRLHIPTLNERATEHNWRRKCRARHVSCWSGSEYRTRYLVIAWLVSSEMRLRCEVTDA